MATTTTVLGLKKPEGSDPFLASDFATNWQKIDDAIGQLRSEGQGSIDADTLGGHPASYFQPAGSYAAAVHSHTGDGGTVDSYTKAESDSKYALASHGHGDSGGTVTTDTVRAPNRVNPRTQFSVTQVIFNGTNGEVVTIPYSEMAYNSPPTALLSVQIGSNFDMVANVQGRLNHEMSVRVARVTGQLTGTESTPYTNCFLHWLVMGP